MPASSALYASACVLFVIAMVASEGVEPRGRRKRDIMMPMFNEPSSFYENGRQRRYITSDRGHPHNHNFNYHYNRDFSPYPGDFPGGRVPEQFDNSPRLMQSNLMTRLKGVDTIEDFLKYVQSSTGIKNRISSDEVSNDGLSNENIPMAQPAKCRLEEVTVQLDIALSNPNYMYYPTCTRVMRCGGCCTNTITSCQATRSENITMRVIVTEYSDDDPMMTLVKKEVVQVANHTACKCDCTIKPQDCNRLQVYRKNECRCACTNVDDMQRCQDESDTKMWDHNTCHCSCREERPCSTGSVFNANTCSCMRVTQLRRLGSGRK